MSDALFRDFLAREIPLVDETIYSFLKQTAGEQHLLESMLYSVEAGGKRFRALLVLGTLTTLNQTLTQGHYEVAAALEMVHTYSLIHDDLPAMDNDDLRRGKPTNHRVFGEAMAILAGDGLLTEAFHLLSVSALTAEIKINLLSLLGQASGTKGMIAGQVTDMIGENKSITLEQLQGMHRRKTGALITYGVQSAAVMSRALPELEEALVRFSEHVGMAFQIRDDLLDVIGDEKEIGKKTGMDQQQNKNTYVSLLGLEGAKLAFYEQYKAANHELQRAKKLMGKESERTLLDSMLEELKGIK